MVLMGIMWQLRQLEPNKETILSNSQKLISTIKKGIPDVAFLSSFVDEKRIKTSDETIIKKEKPDATSGKIFANEKIRTFDVAKLIFGGGNKTNIDQGEIEVEDKCEKWGVTTTIFSPPSETIRRFLYRPNWCIVIVGDEKTKDNEFFIETSVDNQIYYLSSDDQKKVKLGFVEQLPWNSFARKNVGYLYAISRGARVIYDFDDDNLIKFWMRDGSPDSSLDIDYIIDHAEEFGKTD